ncbi:MAG TPA: glycosyltransferase family 39 protein, partial [Gemmatimonadaceae bacterium]
MKPSADAFARYSPWIAVGVALLYFLHDRLELGGSLLLLVCCAGLTLAGTLVRWRDLVHAPTDATFDVPRRALRATALLLAASLAIAVLRALLSGESAMRSAIVAAVIPVLLGWSIFLVLPLARPAEHRGSAPPSVAQAPVVAGLLVATIVALAVSMRVADHWTSIDEVVYSLQAHLFVQGEFRWHLDDGVQRFFTLPLMVPTSQGPYSQYPPGYPGILAGFIALGAPWVSGAVLGAITVGSAYMLGRRSASPFVGVLAAALLATHFLFLEYASGYLSHVAEMAALTAAAWLVFTPASASRKQRVGEAVLAGLFLGVAVTIRPVTAVGLGLSLWLWLLVRRGWSATRDTTLFLALGAAIPCV